jgi:hypothetical protein
MSEGQFLQWSTTVLSGTTQEFAALVAESAINRALAAKRQRYQSLAPVGEGAKAPRKSMFVEPLGREGSFEDQRLAFQPGSSLRRTSSPTTENENDRDKRKRTKSNAWDKWLPRDVCSPTSGQSSKLETHARPLSESRLSRLELVKRRVEMRKKKEAAADAARNALRNSWKPIGPPPEPCSLSQFSLVVAELSKGADRRKRPPPACFSMYN